MFNEETLNKALSLTFSSSKFVATFELRGWKVMPKKIKFVKFDIKLHEDERIEVLSKNILNPSHKI